MSFSFRLALLRMKEKQNEGNKNKQKQVQSRSLVFKEASVQGIKQVLIFLNRPGRIRRGFLRADRRRRS